MMMGNVPPVLIGVGSGLRSRRRAPPSASRSASSSPRQWIGTELELHDLARRALAAFHVEGRSRAHRRPEPAALPAGGGIVNSTVQPFGEEPQRVGDAQDDPLSLPQQQESFRPPSGG